MERIDGEEVAVASEPTGTESRHETGEHEWRGDVPVADAREAARELAHEPPRSRPGRHADAIRWDQQTPILDTTVYPYRAISRCGSRRSMAASSTARVCSSPPGPWSRTPTACGSRKTRLRDASAREKHRGHPRPKGEAKHSSFSAVSRTFRMPRMERERARKR